VSVYLCLYTCTCSNSSFLHYIFST